MKDKTWHLFYFLNFSVEKISFVDFSQANPIMMKMNGGQETLLSKSFNFYKLL